MERVVIWDPSGAHLEGEVLKGLTTEQGLDERLITLPIHAELIDRCGAGGYVVRRFGKGVEYDANDRRFGCAISLYAFPGYRTLSWVARVVSTRGDAQIEGTLKLTGESGKPGGASGGLIATEPPFPLTASKLDASGKGVLIGGKAQLAIAQPGFLSLALFGLMTGGRVEWLAVSQSP